MLNLMLVLEVQLLLLLSLSLMLSLRLLLLLLVPGMRWPSGVAETRTRTEIQRLMLLRLDRVLRLVLSSDGGGRVRLAHELRRRLERRCVVGVVEGVVQRRDS